MKLLENSAQESKLLIDVKEKESLSPKARAVR